MKVYESAVFSTNANGHEFCRCKHAAGIDGFVDYFMGLHKANQTNWSKSNEIPEKFKTIRGMTTFIARKNYYKPLDENKRIVEYDDHTLIFFEKPRREFDISLNKMVMSSESLFYAFKVRDANEDELRTKKEEEDEVHSFDIRNITVRYKATVIIDHREDAPTSVDGQKIGYFNTFDEAKDFVEKLRKAWHMQMTLRGLSSQIQHNQMNVLTVYKPKCAIKYLHSFNFWIKSEMKYNNGTKTP